jgi:hypothetical protein
VCRVYTCTPPCSQIYLFFVEWRRLDGRAVFPSPCCELLWGSSVLCHSGHALAKVCVRRLRQRDATARSQAATMNFFSYAKTTAAHTYFMTTMMGPGICKKQDVATPVCRTRPSRNSPIPSDSMRATRTKTDATCVRRADQKTFLAGERIRLQCTAGLFAVSNKWNW